MQMIDLTFVFRSLKGRCHSNQVGGGANGIGDNNCTPHCALAFHNTLEDRNFDIKRLNGDNLSTLYRNLVKYSPVGLTIFLERRVRYRLK